MDKKYCGSCEYFHQHYILNGRGIVRVYCGHCTYQRIRTRRPDRDACDHYVPAPPDEDAFATREYLSKELLRYVLKLEPLPEIQWEEQRKVKR